MNRFMKPALALGVVGAIALAAATPSEARNGRNAAAIGAGVAGFAVGAAIGSAAAANNGYYYQQPSYGYYEPTYSYGYYEQPAYEGYAYAPRATRYYRGDPSSYYAPGGAYGPHSYSGWDNRERALRGGDW